jgi:hypothetical protein
MHRPSVDLCARCHGFPVGGPAWSNTAPPIVRTSGEPG